MQLHLVHSVFLIYKFPLVYYHDWDDIPITKVTNLVSHVNYLSKCRKMNGIWFFHFIDIPLLCIDVCTRQNNPLKHGFYSLLIYLFLFLLTNVGNFGNIYDHMFININHFLSYPSVNCILFLLLGIEKLCNQSWCGVVHLISNNPTNFTLDVHLSLQLPSLPML
jgi:hypothetical protein